MKREQVVLWLSCMGNIVLLSVFIAINISDLFDILLTGNAKCPKLFYALEGIWSFICLMWASSFKAEKEF
jgi:hypothetical protein